MQEWVATDPSRTIRRFNSHEEQEAETMRYWKGRSIGEKMQAVAELVRDGYLLRGIDIYAERPKRSIRRIELSRS